MTGPGDPTDPTDPGDPRGSGRGAEVCAEHPGRPAAAVCRRCERPICTECMVQAPVGWQCRRCVKEWSRTDTGGRYRPATAGPLGNSRISPLVLALIGVNVVVFLLTGLGTASSVQRFAMQPLLVRQGQTYRLVTAAFLHANIPHILFNMFALAIVGPAVEALMGRVRFLVLYLLAAVGGSVCSYLLSPADIYGLGASGAIFGLFGAYFVLARRRHLDVGTVVALIVINLIIGFADPGIDWRAHIGGLVVGAGVALGFTLADDQAGSARILVDALTVAVTLAALAALIQLPPGRVNL